MSEWPAEFPVWIVWERAPDGGRPYIRAIDTTEAYADRHIDYLRMEAYQLGKPPPDLLVEESKANHLYAQNFLAALQRRREKER